MIPEAAHARFRELCDGASHFVLVTHLNPDGDALGSQLSLARYLLSRGKSLRIVNHDATPESLRFLEDSTLPIEIYSPGEHDATLHDADLVVLVDNSAPDRLGRMERVMREVAGHVLCIDHHPFRDFPWAHPIVDEQSCATAVMVWELTQAQGWTPDVRSAEAIYVGLATDTGFFRFNSTNARAHEVAGRLLRMGVSPARAYREVYERNTVAFTRLMGHALAAVRIEADGALAVARLDRALVERLAADAVDTAEIATALLAIDGVRMALLFRELADGRIKVSLRSKGPLDVHRLASIFGGGGHRNASGIVMPGDLDTAVEHVTQQAARLCAGETS